MIDSCSRCKRHLIEVESHHVWCKFMDNPHGYSWKEYPNRFNLCFTCHKAVKQIVILPILNKYARTLKFNNGEYWLWKYQIAEIDKTNVIEDICAATLKFIFEYEDGNTKTA